MTDTPDTPQGSIACPHCGRRFAWWPELAGRPIQCKCERTFRAPLEPTGRAEVIDADPAATSAPSEPPLEPSSDDPTDPGAAPDAPTNSNGDTDAEPDAEPPAEPHAETELEEDNTYALNLPEEGLSTAAARGEQPAKCPNCNQRITPGAVLCVKCGFDLKEGRKMRTEVAADAPAVQGGAPAAAQAKPAPPSSSASASEAVSPTASAVEAGSSRDPRLALASMTEVSDMPTAGTLATAEESRRKQRIDAVVPGVLIALGLGGTFVRYFYLTPELGAGASLIGAIANTVFTLVLLVPVALLGMLIAVKLLGVAFGTLGMAMYKLVGLVLMAAPLVGFLSYFLPGFIPGFVTGLMIAIAVACPLASMLFDLDFGEAVLVMVIIFFLAVVAMILGLFTLLAGLRLVF